MTKKYSHIYLCLILTLSFLVSVSPSKAEQTSYVFFDDFSLNGRVDYLIITPNSFLDEVKPLSIWKLQKGISTSIKTVQEIEIEYSGKNLAEKIKNCIIDYYEHNDTKWILLAGDYPQLPSQYVEAVEDFPWDGDVVSCDSYFADLDNNWDLNNDGAYGTAQDKYDFIPEVYVGRIPANNEGEMKMLIQRTINYEKNPDIGWWMERALFAGSILYFNLDWNGDNIVDYKESDGNHVNNFINQTHFNRWNTTFLAQRSGVKGSDYYSDMQFSLDNLIREINKGASVGSIIAHGSEIGMGIHEWTVDYDGDLLFDYTACPFNESGVEIDEKVSYTLLSTSTPGLNPIEGQYGLYYLGSCSTGTFDIDEDCLAEYLLKEAAIGVIASSYVTWGEDEWYERDHGGWFIEGLDFRFWEQFMISNRPGEALALAKADYVADRSVSPEPNDFPDWEDKCLKQYNLFCDPELPIWTKIPKELNMSESVINDNNYTVVISAEGETIENATITFVKNGKLLWVDKSDENGEILIPISHDLLEGMVCTVSKDGYVAYQKVYPQTPINSIISGYNIAFLLSLCIILIGTISAYLYKLECKGQIH